MDTAAVVSARAGRHHRDASLLWSGIAGAVTLTVAAAVLGASASERNPTAYALLRACLVGAPLVVGLYCLHAAIQPRFARLLLATGGLAFVTALGEASDPVVYSVGRIAGWGMEVLIAVVLLACPTGRLEGRADRLLAWVMGLAVALFYLPTLLIAPAFRVPSAWTGCVQNCPRNVFFALDDVPPALADAVRLLGSVSVFLIMLAVVVRVQQRQRGLSPAGRRMLTPVLAVGSVRAALLGVGLLLREAGGDADGIQLIAWLLAVCVPALPLAYGIGLIRARLYSEDALHRLATVIDSNPAPRRLELALTELLEDRSTQLLLPIDGRPRGWRTAGGEDASLPAEQAGRTVQAVRNHDDEVVGAIVHGADVVVDPRLIGAAASMTGVALDNHRLGARADEAAREVFRSRERLVATAERERRRIERDIHDGAQQQLVALRIELGLLEDLAERDPGRFGARLSELQTVAESALEELRALAHGMCPPLLADRGIAEALQAASRRCRASVDLRAHDVSRYPPEIESAVYFCVLEALQNVDKHAVARHVVVDVRGGGRELRFSVHDDGHGIDPSELRDGDGLMNMRDRMAALGGELHFDSARGMGTTVTGVLPLRRRRPYVPFTDARASRPR
jgi:signal transduction histidine kinase